LHGTPMGAEGPNDDHRLGGGAQPREDGALCRADGLLTRGTDAPRFLPRMASDRALASLASRRAVAIGAECGCGVHDAPPGCAWKHCHEEYVWTPVCFTTSPHHGLVWSYRNVEPVTSVHMFSHPPGQFR